MQVTEADILEKVTGEKQGFVLKKIEGVSGDLATVSEEKNLSFANGKTGQVTATLILSQDGYEDATIENARFATSSISNNGVDYCVVKTKTGRIWLDRNLGAEQVAAAVDDSKSYGDLYQFGRGNDGHQKRDSTVITTKATGTTAPVPGHGNFIYDRGELNWHSGKKEAEFWKEDGSGINNPCPTGFRVPTSAEYNAEIQHFNPQNKDGAFQSALKLPSNGDRGRTVAPGGFFGIYWTASLNNPDDPTAATGDDTGFALTIAVVSNRVKSEERQKGFAIRCIKS